MLARSAEPALVRLAPDAIHYAIKSPRWREREPFSSVRALVNDMVTERQLAALPSSSDPAFTPASCLA
jgi:hypothetical protein